MVLTSRMQALIEESALLNARLSRRLKSAGLDLLIWVSPSSCRSPEETKLWHPFYAQRPVLFKIGTYLYILGLYSLVGVVRFFSYGGFFYNLLKTSAPVLLVIPDEITDHSAQWRTDYIIEDEAHPVDKLVFSRIKNVGIKFSKLGYLKRAKIFSKLLSEAISDFTQVLLKKKMNFAYVDAFVIYLRWVVSQSWCFHWDFYHLLKEVLGPSANYKAFLSMHEMHFYSKVIWRVAEEEGKIGITAQHAMIVPEKLWYFPHKTEVQAGCPLPKVFFVYSEFIKDTLSPLYPGTKFILCCSPRFNKWKRGVASGVAASSDKQFVTFVGAIPFYDTKILICAIKALLEEKSAEQLPIKFRPHPAAEISPEDKRWMEEAARREDIIVSKGSLKEDLDSAALVIGSNSTVLQEAALSGVCALELHSPDFVSASVLPESEQLRISGENISWDRLKRHINTKPDEAIIEDCRKNMGLSNADFTTRMVYEAV